MHTHTQNQIILRYGLGKDLTKGQQTFLIATHAGLEVF